MKKSKADKRKAKVKAKKQQAILNKRSLSAQLASALEKLCEPVIPEYIDGSNGLDLVGRRIVYQMGFIAWNIAVTGRKELADSAFKNTDLNAEQRSMVQQEIAGLVKRKYAEFPNLRTAMRDFSVSLVNGAVRLKVQPGDTFPEIPMQNIESTAHSGEIFTQQNTEEPMKHSFYDVKAKANVTTEVTDLVSYGEGKTQRFAFKGKTQDGRNLTAFVGREDWEKAKKKK